VEAINKVPLPQNKKSLQYFLGHINFVRRFIPNFSEKINPILKLLKKYANFEWCDEGRKTFKGIKDAIKRSHVLISPDYSKDFSDLLLFIKGYYCRSSSSKE